MYITRRERRILLITTACLTLFVVVCFLYPIYFLFSVSLKTQQEAFKTPPSWIFWPMFRNYTRLFADRNFFRYFLNSIIVSVGSTFCALGLGIPAAYALSRGRFRGKNRLLFFVLGTQMVPPVLFIVPFFMAYVRFGLMDTHVGLIIINLIFTLALAIWSMRAFFDDVPIEIEQAAWIDGASVLQALIKVLLPLVSPGIVATGILCMILSWNPFIFPLMLTRNKAVTVPVAIMRYAVAEAEDWGLMAAGSMMLTLPVFFFSILLRRYLTRGLVRGALKG